MSVGDNLGKNIDDKFQDENCDPNVTRFIMHANQNLNHNDFGEQQWNQVP